MAISLNVNLRRMPSNIIGPPENVLFEAMQEYGWQQQASILFGAAKAGSRKKIGTNQPQRIELQRLWVRPNFSALEFHHTDSTVKSFALDLRSLSNRKWSSIVVEAEKCVLLCSNCHKETHNPDCIIDRC